MPRFSFSRSTLLIFSCAALLLTMLPTESKAQGGFAIVGRVKGTITVVNSTTTAVTIVTKSDTTIVLYVVPNVTKITINGKPNRTILELQAAVAAANAVGQTIETMSIYDGVTMGAFTITAKSSVKP